MLTKSEWKQAFGLYQSAWQKRRLFEHPSMKEREFRRCEKNLIIWKKGAEVAGIAFLFCEGKGVLLKNLFTENSPSKFLSYLKSNCRKAEFIRVMIPAGEMDWAKACKEQGFKPSLKRLRMLGALSSLASKASLPEGYSVRSYEIKKDRNRFAKMMNATFCKLAQHQRITSQTVKNWENEPAFDKRGYLFLEHGKQTVGFLAFSAIRRKFGVLHEIGMLPQYRNRGLGTSFFAQVAPFCRRKKVRNIFLSVSADNRPAVSFYEKLKFKQLYSMETYEWRKNA